MENKKGQKTLVQVRLDIHEYIKSHKHIPEEYKDFIYDFTNHAIDNLFRSIGLYMSAVELVFRRTRDYPDIKTIHEKALKLGKTNEKK